MLLRIWGVSVFESVQSSFSLAHIKEFRKIPFLGFFGKPQQFEREPGFAGHPVVCFTRQCTVRAKIQRLSLHCAYLTVDSRRNLEVPEVAATRARHFQHFKEHNRG